ncbi:unnamed protein product [Paramecium sonneborni]|uniref:Uncharacterized protein n=1 Tax=Paramecium sonneborni TaxID=65129 RepID=A0A8S1Q8Z1_9CILI|nr:unnamed protein product [Paramecium sonneborni]
MLIKNQFYYQNQKCKSLIKQTIQQSTSQYFQLNYLNNITFIQFQNTPISQIYKASYQIEINQIFFESLIFKNSQQEHKVSISQFCNNQSQLKNQLLHVIGFQQLSISNSEILNLFSINYQQWIQDLVLKQLLIQQDKQYQQMYNIQGIYNQKANKPLHDSWFLQICNIIQILN